MPQFHTGGNGMNQCASVGRQGLDRFAVKGMMSHVPDKWELRFDVNAGQDRESPLTSKVL